MSGYPENAMGRRMVELTPADAIDLLAKAPFGRVVFTQGALPAIRPVNHIVDRDEIIIRARLGSAFSAATKRASQTVVAYQADAIDPETRLGWSVVITGIARRVADPDEIARYEKLLHPWIDGALDAVVSIRPEIISGFQLVAA